MNQPIGRRFLAPGPAPLDVGSVVEPLTGLRTTPPAPVAMEPDVKYLGPAWEKVTPSERQRLQQIDPGALEAMRRDWEARGRPATAVRGIQRWFRLSREERAAEREAHKAAADAETRATCATTAAVDRARDEASLSSIKEPGSMVNGFGDALRLVIREELAHALAELRPARPEPIARRRPLELRAPEPAQNPKAAPER